MRITGEMGNLAAWEKRLFYMCSARPTLHPRALFSDVTSDYRSPAEPVPGDEVTIRLRTGRYNVDKAYLVVDNVEHVMTRVRSESMFDYYEAKINVGTDKIYYYFKVELGRTVCYYNQIGAIKDLNPYYNFQITPGFKTPEWAKGAVMYQIFVDRFYNGDKSNDVLDDEYNYIGEHVCQVKDWNKYPAQMGIREFYGGDLKGVLDKLDYLEGLGIEVIYFNPLFVSPSNHKYDIQDYDYIDPHFGVIVDDEGEVLKEGDTDNTHATRYINRVTRKSNLEASNEFFVQFVEEVHRRGMKVILDGVFNHCGSFNKWLDRERIYEAGKGYEPGAYVAQDSPYHTFFKFYNEHNWPYNEFYDGWWGHDTLPKLNYEGSEKLMEDIMRIGAKWVSPPFNADGWRLDVADELPDGFIEFLRKRLKSIDPDGVLLGEVWEEATNKHSMGGRRKYVDGHELDSVMDYPFRRLLMDFFLGRIDGEGLARGLLRLMENYPPQFYESLLNLMGSHDVVRAITALAGAPDRDSLTREQQAAYSPTIEQLKAGRKRFMAAAAVQYMMPGAPCLYYGDEAGLTGMADPFNRGTYPWGQEDTELIAYFQKLGELHKRAKGGCAFAGRGDVFTLYRPEVICMVNRSCEPVTACFADKDFCGNIRAELENGCIERELPPYGAAILIKGQEERA